MKDKFVEIVKDVIQDNPDLNYSDLATKIQTDGLINRSHRTLRLYVADVAKMIKDGDFDDIEDSKDTTDTTQPPDTTEDDVIGVTYSENDIQEDDEMYKQYKSLISQSDDEKAVTPNDEVKEEVEPEEVVEEESIICSSDNYDINSNNEYILKYSSTLIHIPISTVDKAFLSHSRSGLNLTEQQTTKLLNLSETEFKAMKARLLLCKDSDSVGPYSDDIYTPEEVFELLAKNTSELLTDLPDVDDPVRSTLIRETKKQLVLAQNRNKQFASFIENLKDRVHTIETRQIVGNGAEIKAPREVTAVISDLHLGVISDIYNLRIAENKLKEVQDHINALTSVTPGIGVNIVLPGDIMHNISGFMHEDAFKHTEFGMWGADSIIKPYELLYNFFMGIKGIQAVYIVGGNHDRMNGDWKKEKSAEGAKLLAFMLSSTLPKEINVEFDARLVKFDSGELRFIVQHGDLKADKKQKVEEVVWEHGVPDKFNIVMTGHHHTRIIARGDDTYRAIRMSVPGFSPTDDYAKDQGYNNNPGFLLIQEKQGKPAIIDVPLIY